MVEISNIFSGFDMSVIISKIYFFVGLFFLLLIIGGIIGGIILVRTRNKRQRDVKNIGWWEEVSGTERMEPAQMDKVEEIIIPGTTLRVFYCKKKDLWLPRFNKGITKDLFYVLRTSGGKMVNFTLKSLGKDLREADLDHDDTDMTWAAENTREYIKRNYRDKSVKWWQAYQGVITTAIYILIMTFSMVIIIYFMRGIVDDLGRVASTIAEAVKTSCANAATSGVTPA
jgi:hypothetical protein